MVFDPRVTDFRFWSRGRIPVRLNTATCGGDARLTFRFRIPAGQIAESSVDGTSAFFFLAFAFLGFALAAAF